jgi:hypothetical protein
LNFLLTTKLVNLHITEQGDFKGIEQDSVNESILNVLMRYQLEKDNKSTLDNILFFINDLNIILIRIFCIF